MRIVSGFNIREVLDEIIAVPSGEAAKELSGIISLNEVGKFLFQQLNQDQTEQSLVAALMEAYEVDLATARTDVKEFLDHLRKFNLIQE